MPEKPVDMRVSYVEHPKNMEVVYSLINQRVVKKDERKECKCESYPRDEISIHAERR
jgi:hypothetical protein